MNINKGKSNGKARQRRLLQRVPFNVIYAPLFLLSAQTQAAEADEWLTLLLLLLLLPQHTP
jgi:hypothetical protein